MSFTEGAASFLLIKTETAIKPVALTTPGREKGRRSVKERSCENVRPGTDAGVDCSVSSVPRCGSRGRAAQQGETACGRAPVKPAREGAWPRARDGAADLVPLPPPRPGKEPVPGSVLLAEAPGLASRLPRPQPYVLLLSFAFSALLSWRGEERGGSGCPTTGAAAHGQGPASRPLRARVPQRRTTARPRLSLPAGGGCDTGMGYGDMGGGQGDTGMGHKGT